jgi:hypothetical protein
VCRLGKRGEGGQRVVEIVGAEDGPLRPGHRGENALNVVRVTVGQRDVAGVPVRGDQGKGLGDGGDDLAGLAFPPVGEVRQPDAEAEQHHQRIVTRRHRRSRPNPGLATPARPVNAGGRRHCANPSATRADCRQGTRRAAAVWPG